MTLQGWFREHITLKNNMVARKRKEVPVVLTIKAYRQDLKYIN